MNFTPESVQSALWLIYSVGGILGVVALCLGAILVLERHQQRRCPHPASVPTTTGGQVCVACRALVAAAPSEGK